MENLFKNKKTGTQKTVQATPPRSGIDLPFSQSGSSGKGVSSSGSLDNKKTRIGRQPDMPFVAKGKKDDLTCPKCQYPLRIEPSPSSPCPNCGYSETDGIHDTASDSKKTILLKELSLEDEETLSEFKFKMISESSGSEFKIESTEDEIVLNRDHLDPNNNTISSQEHLLVKFREGRIFITDVSTNGSTFVQVMKKMPVCAGTRIVMGNRIFLLTGGKEKESQVSDKATRLLSRVSFDHNSNDDFALIEERSGRKIFLAPGINLLKRNNLDPGNLSISGNKHAELEFSHGQWLISDLSSNAATFIQCRSEHQMTNKERIIVGNMIFRFEYD